jgi:Protein of unknown function (DUF4058)
MSVHDWTRVDAGLFHSFHQHWIVALCEALNTGGLPPDYFALAEQSIRGPIRDVLTVRLSPGKGEPSGTAPALDIATAPPRARVVRSTEIGVYARKADRVTVRHRHGQIVAVIEIVSPGNKGSISELRAFVAKTADLIQQGIHVLVIDLFPPTRRDAQGLHKAIWDEFEDVDFVVPADKPLTLASYSASPIKTAYVESIAVGDVLPDMALFLESELYVSVLLEATYQTTWNVFPAALKGLLEPTNASDASQGVEMD